MIAPPVNLGQLAQRIADYYHGNGFDEVDVDAEVDVDEDVPSASLTEAQVTLTPCPLEETYFDTEAYVENLMMDATDRFGLMAAPFNTHRVSWNAKEADLAKLRKPGCVDVFFTDGHEVEFRFEWVGAVKPAATKPTAKPTSKIKTKPKAKTKAKARTKKKVR